MKGIILAGGNGSRLRPMTAVVSKQLLPVYDKPLIYYSLSALMLAGIRDILIICTPDHRPVFESLLGAGTHLGLTIRYTTQSESRGVADALIVGRNFIADGKVCLILGDNIFYGHEFPQTVRQEIEKLDGCTLFGYPVADPERYGVAVFDDAERLIDLVEKPIRPRSNLAVTGLYLYDNEAVQYAAELVPSARGELEITDLNRRFVAGRRAKLVNLGRGIAWLDTGTADSLLEAGLFVQVIQKRQGVQIACLEEVAYRMGYIDVNQLGDLARRVGPDNEQGRYLSKLLHAENHGPARDA